MIEGILMAALTVLSTVVCTSILWGVVEVFCGDDGKTGP